MHIESFHRLLYHGLWAIVIPPDSNAFSDWRRTCHVSWVKLTNSLRKQQLELSTRHVITGVVFLKRWQICEPAGIKQATPSHLVFYFWVGRYNKTLNDWSREKQRVLFPLDFNVPRGERSRVNITHCFPWGQSLLAYYTMHALQMQYAYPCFWGVFTLILV